MPWREETRRGVQSGVLFGLTLAPALAAAEVLAYLALGLGAERPLRFGASLLAGPAAFTWPDGPTVTLVAFGMHLALAVLWGGLYGLLASRAPDWLRRDVAAQAALGVLFGAVVWVVDFRLVGPVWAPLAASDPALPQALLHIFGFGLPLGLMTARVERRVPALLPDEAGLSP